MFAVVYLGFCTNCCFRHCCSTGTCNRTHLFSFFFTAYLSNYLFYYNITKLEKFSTLFSSHSALSNYSEVHRNRTRQHGSLSFSDLRTHLHNHWSTKRFVFNALFLHLFRLISALLSFPTVPCWFQDLFGDVFPMLWCFYLFCFVFDEVWFPSGVFHFLRLF